MRGHSIEKITKVGAGTLLGVSIGNTTEELCSETSWGVTPEIVGGVTAFVSICLTMFLYYNYQTAIEMTRKHSW